MEPFLMSSLATKKLCKLRFQGEDWLREWEQNQALLPVYSQTSTERPYSLNKLLEIAPRIYCKLDLYLISGRGHRLDFRIV